MPLATAQNCFSYYCNGLRKPIAAHSLAPFVEIRAATDENKFISVGNKSDSGNSTAVIKSFQFGESDGVGATVEIFDEEGGDFFTFAQKIVRNLNQDITDTQILCKWGWITTDCNNNVSVISSRSHKLITKECEVNFTAGGLLFKLELIDNITLSFETRTNRVYGTDSSDGRLPLKQAIINLFRDANPRVEVVKFLRRKQTPSNTSTNSVNFGNLLEDTEEIEFEAGVGDMGPRYAWQANNQNPLAAARSWVMPYVTRGQNRGVIVFWDSTAPVGTLIFMEDPFPPCVGSDVESCHNSIGTFIVNGGSSSPVIQFSPSIKFNFAAAAKSGAAIDSQGARPAKMEGPVNCNPNNDLGGDGVGRSSNPVIPDHLRDNWIYGQAAQQAARANAAHQRANILIDGIEAELRIQGDPSLDDPNTLKAKTCSILVINPFHVVASGQGCGEWLARPPCNEILSNKAWRIMGVSHEVKEGSYTTTLKIRLNQPGTTASL